VLVTQVQGTTLVVLPLDREPIEERTS
jgi:hypothetical protein